MTPCSTNCFIVWTELDHDAVHPNDTLSECNVFKTVNKETLVHDLIDEVIKEIWQSVMLL